MSDPNRYPPDQPTDSVCATCGDQGWITDHEDKCYEDGDCSCSGVQVECPACGDHDTSYQEPIPF